MYRILSRRFIYMNFKISAIIRARIIKFAENVSYYCSQLKYVLEFGQAFYNFRKPKQMII